MKFSCTKEKLNKALSLVVGVANKNINLPILGNILIRAEIQKVELIVNNLELAVVANLSAKTEAPGAFTVPARTLSDFIALLPNENIEVELKENELAVTCGKSSTKIKGAPAEEFPMIPAVEEGRGFAVNTADFKRGLAQVLPAVAKNDIRPELSGVCFNFNSEYYNGLVIAATDSYRLAEKKLPLASGTDNVRIIMPGRTAQELSHVLALSEGSDSEPTVRILVGENQVAINYDSVQLISRLVDGQYPDYAQIIPKEQKTTAVFPTDRLVKEIKAASLFTTTGVNAVSLDLNVSQGTIGVSSTSTQTGEYSSEISADLKGEENSILLNHRYILDGLNNLGSDTTTLQVISGDNPCMLLPDNDKSYLYIVMPIRQ